MINAITIVHNHDLTSMIENYVQDEDFVDIFSRLINGILHEPFSLKRGFIMHGSKICIVKNLHEKAMFESHVPPYVGHRGIQATTKEIETYFYWLSMCKDIQKYVEQCLVCQRVKYGRGNALELLQPLPIPNAP